MPNAVPIMHTSNRVAPFFIDSFLWNNHRSLVRAAADPEPILETGQDIAYLYTPTAMFLKDGTPMKIYKTPTVHGHLQNSTKTVTQAQDGTSM